MKKKSGQKSAKKSEREIAIELFDKLMELSFETQQQFLGSLQNRTKSVLKRANWHGG